jgi:PIN domain nuclease of toxin-antitoxin system
MKVTIVFDASAVLALLLNEPGAEKLTEEILEHSVASTVNLAEVQTTLVRSGYDPDEAWEDALEQVAAAEPFTSEQSKIAGTLVKTMQPFGLSLGDRACLALAIVLKAEVYTTEKVWKNLKLGISIHVIR